MAINTIEQDIITQLESVITDLQIEGFPEKPKEYRLLHSKGAILVSFNSADYMEPESLVIIQQEVDMEFGLILLIRNLRDTNGAYSYIDTIVNALTGYAPTGCAKMYPKRTGFLNETNGIWQYSLTFNVRTENFKA